MMVFVAPVRFASPCTTLGTVIVMFAKKAKEKKNLHVLYRRDEGAGFSGQVGEGSGARVKNHR